LSKPETISIQPKADPTLEEQLAAFDWVAGLYEGEQLTREQIGKELADFRFIIDQVPRVYMHITGQRMSKATYYADSVIAEHDSHVDDIVADETRRLGWLPIAEHDGSSDPVDVWRDGERFTDFSLVNGRWQRKVGYPTVTQVLTTPPTHFLCVPEGPAA